MQMMNDQNDFVLLFITCFFLQQIQSILRRDYLQLDDVKVFYLTLCIAITANTSIAITCCSDMKIKIEK